MKRANKIRILILFLGVVLLSFMTESQVWAKDDVHKDQGNAQQMNVLGDINTSLDLFDNYGNCGGSLTGLYGSKVHLVLGALIQDGQPETIKDVLAIKLLSCTTFSGMGPSYIVPCPNGSPWTYCVGNDNDGLAHNILLGVLTLNEATDPNANYSGCTGSGIPQSKLALYQLAGGDPHMINGIVTLRCSAARRKHEGRHEGRHESKATVEQVACPTGSPFKYCVQTSNDGHGNAVLLGAIGANGAGDPYALYGNCTSNGEGQSGFRAKANILTDVGISLDTVRTIDIIGCANPSSNGFPPPLQVVSCSSLVDRGLPEAIYYDQCVAGLDAKNNSLFVGINK